MVSIIKMQSTHISDVLSLEKICFGEGWTSTPFDKELYRNDCSYFIAVENGFIVGYSGSWTILEELHITIMAVHPNHRKHKTGQKLLINLIKEGLDSGAKWVTLEVKASNIPAQKLYEKFGFSVKGRRKQYYHQDREDALIMWTEEIDTPEYSKRLLDIESELLKV
jgi:ribosomal-protein-alanine N-acetyltransferase